MAPTLSEPEQDERSKLENTDNDDQAAGNPTDPRGHDVAAGDASDPRGPATPASKDNQPANDPSDPRGAYDNSLTEPSAPPGGNPGPKKSGAKNANELNNIERSAGKGHPPDKTADNGRKSFYTPSPEPPQRAQLRKLLDTRRKRVVFGGGVVFSTLGIVLFITFISGPLQFIHLSHILARGFEGDQHTSHLRLTRLYRYAKTGQAGETRVGEIGSRYFGKSIDQLRDVGIEFQTNSYGYMKSATFDTAKLESKYPEMKGMSLADQKAFLGEKFGLDPASFNRVNGKLAINTRDFGVGATRALLNNSIDVLDSGKVLSSIKLRVLSDYFDVPSLWHPLERAKANQYKKLSVKAQRAAAKKAEEDRLKALETTADAPKAIEAKTKIKNALQDNSGKITAFVTVQGAVCLIYGVANEAVTFNRAAIVLPSTLQAADKVALGEQVKSGQDFDNSQLSATAASFKDDQGNTIWQGRALQAAAGNTSPAGADLPTQYSEAFSGTTTADSIKKSVEVNLPIVGNVTGLVCSGPALAAGFVAGVAVLVSGAFDFGASDAAYAAAKAGEFAATAGVYYMLQKESLSIIKDKAIVAEVLSGPLGGNLMAFGSREMANIAARSTGGVAMAGTAASVVGVAEQKADDQQFARKSWFAKLFDVKDYRSASGKLIDSTSTSFLDNLAKMGSGLFHVGRIFSSIGNLFFHHASAASQPYNWGFERYGIPDSVAADPKFDDPYANAAQVASILDGQDCGQDSSCYINRAKACFGVTINKDADSKWQVQPSNDVNPGDQSYTDAHCNEDSDNWHRLQLFVFDSRTMDAAACYQGDDDSCKNTGVGAGATATSSASPGGIYLNPLRDVQKNGSLTAKRVDQGVDYGGNGPVYALGNGVIKTIATNAGWPGGNFINYQLSDGPAAGKYVFVAENCTPNPALKEGQAVSSSTVLCTMQNTYPYIETGWAADPAGGTVALAHNDWGTGVDDEAHYTALGRNFSDLLQSLGAPAGTIASGAQQLGALPSGWPTW